MQKITPFLWFDNNAEEAIQTYVAHFENAEILNSDPMSGDRPEVKASNTLSTIRLPGFEIILFNGGPDHYITPAVSFFVGCESADQLDRLWNALVEGGDIFMPLGEPVAERIEWFQQDVLAPVAPVPAAPEPVASEPGPSVDCDPSYPVFCLVPSRVIGEMDCGDIP